jgi:hypothetical protein
MDPDSQKTEITATAVLLTVMVKVLEKSKTSYQIQ